MYLKNISLTDYSLDNKNSRPEEKATRLDPGCPRELAINIKEITVEMKISEIEEISLFNNYDEDELEEVTLKLLNGYAEGL